LPRPARVFGVSRKAYYVGVKEAGQYGLSALQPRTVARPHRPNAMSSEGSWMNIS